MFKGGESPEITTSAPPADGYRFDVFISYRQSEPDKAWTQKVLLPELLKKGLKVCIDFRSFRLGFPLVNQMERAVEESRYTLAVLSPAYLKGGFTEFESVMADHLGLEQSKKRFISILREDCKSSLRIRARLWLDMTNESEF